MNDVRRTFAAFGAGALLSAAIAYFLRPESPFDRLETLPAALAAATAEGDLDPFEKHVAPEFRLTGAPGIDVLDRAQTAGILGELFARGLKAGVVSCEPAATDDEDGRRRVVVETATLDGGRMRPATVTAYAVRRGGRWTFVAAAVSTRR
jgi:hypothetical protein